MSTSDLPPQEYNGTQGGSPRSLEDLPANSLHIALFIRPHDLGTFHWALYLHLNSSEGGWKFHISNLSGGWKSEHCLATTLFENIALVGLVRVAQFPEGGQGEERVSDVIGIMKSFDQNLESIEGVTCRVWQVKVCEKLREEGYLLYDRWEEVEDECVLFGRKNWVATEMGYQPRPVVDSKVCRI